MYLWLSISRENLQSYGLYGVPWPERFSALDLSSDGRVVRMWVRTVTMVLMSLSKTIYHNCFSPPRSKWVEGRVGCCVWLALWTKMAAIELYTPQRAEMVSGMIYAPGPKFMALLTADFCAYNRYCDRFVCFTGLRREQNSVVCQGRQGFTLQCGRFKRCVLPRQNIAI